MSDKKSYAVEIDLDTERQIKERLAARGFPVPVEDRWARWWLQSLNDKMIPLMLDGNGEKPKA